MERWPGFNRIQRAGAGIEREAQAGAHADRYRCAPRRPCRSAADPLAGVRSQGGSQDDEHGRTDQQRDAQTRQSCRSLGWRQDLIERAVAEQWDDQQIMEHTRSRTGEIRTTSGRDTFDNPDFFRRAAVDSIVCRMTGETPQGAVRELAGLSWADFHRRHLRQAGQSVAGLSDTEVITRALTTSDLPLIAGASVNIRIRQTYEAAVSPIGSVFGARDLPDFRPLTEALVDWTTLSVARVGDWANSNRPTSRNPVSCTASIRSAELPASAAELWINGAGAILDSQRRARAKTCSRRER